MAPSHMRGAWVVSESFSVTPVRSPQTPGRSPRPRRERAAPPRQPDPGHARQAGKTRSSDGSSSFPQMIGRGTGAGVILFRFPVYRYSGLPSIGFFDKNVTNFLWEKPFFRVPIPENPRRMPGSCGRPAGPRAAKTALRLDTLRSSAIMDMINNRRNLACPSTRRSRRRPITMSATRS